MRKEDREGQRKMTAVILRRTKRRSEMNWWAAKKRGGIPKLLNKAIK